MRRHIPLTSILLVVTCLAAWSAGQPAVTKLLPGNSDKALKDWKPAPQAFVYAKGEGLTDIYDGGYKHYLDAGVIDAAQNLYKHGRDIMQVTVHTMKSSQAAATFFRQEIGHVNTRRLAKAPGGALVVITKTGQTQGYAYSGKYYITVTPTYSGASREKDTRLFLSVIVKKAAKLK
jgi:hypothetical protein